MPPAVALHRVNPDNLLYNRLFKYTYDAWNRLVKATKIHRESGDSVWGIDAGISPARFRTPGPFPRPVVKGAVPARPREQPCILSDKAMPNDELVAEIEAQRSLMIAVSTGGPRIDSVNDDYCARREGIREALRQRGLDDPNPYPDLWEWYGKWSSGDLPSYQSRRQYISDMYRPLLERIRRFIRILRR